MLKGRVIWSSRQWFEGNCRRFIETMLLMMMMIIVLIRDNTKEEIVKDREKLG